MGKGGRASREGNATIDTKPGGHPRRATSRGRFARAGEGRTLRRPSWLDGVRQVIPLAGDDDHASSVPEGAGRSSP